MICFNPRTHTGCDVALRQCRHHTDVSIHAPTRGATSEGLPCSIRGKRVSIHAPTRGATPNQSFFLPYCFSVSIHAPTRGATGARRNIQHLTICFNPRTHTGCDIRWQTRFHLPTVVSIHAPTRGATVCKVTYYKSIN